MQIQVAALQGADLLELCIDTAFLVMGLTSCAIALLRRRGGARILLWLGLWSASYGLMHLLQVRPAELALPHSLRATAPFLINAVLYLALVFALMAWRELTKLRRMMIWFLVLASITAALGIGWFVVTGVSQRFLYLNQFLAACFLLVLLITLSSKKLSRRYLLLPNRGVLAAGTFIFASEALFLNFGVPLFGFNALPMIYHHLGFMVLLVSFAYSGLEMVAVNEHRLLEIQTELELARQIQNSILPTNAPELSNVRIAATYQPMKSVAGDFYDFVAVDDQHGGVLIADVCGHGVPAALIASMLKVAVKSVAGRADDPGEFLAALSRVLAEPLRGQLVSASYLWLDMQARKARYSAAGHPPLLRCNQSVESIESNGLLFGILPDAEYPVRELPLCPGDRLVLYTDGITEPENATGEPFGDRQLPRLLADHRNGDPAELSRRIIAAVHQWQRTSEPQDDMTLVVIDVT